MTLGWTGYEYVDHIKLVQDKIRWRNLWTWRWTSSLHKTKILSRVRGSVSIITGSGLYDWIYWQLLLQSFVITTNYKNSKSIFSLTLLPWLPRTRSFLVLVLRLSHSVLYHLHSLEAGHRKHIRSSVMDICEPHTKHLFLYRFIYSALRSNWSYPIIDCVFVAARMCLSSRYLQIGLYVTVCLINW
jgi:hypothetical protein